MARIGQFTGPQSNYGTPINTINPADNVLAPAAAAVTPPPAAPAAGPTTNAWQSSPYPVPLTSSQPAPITPAQTEITPPSPTSQVSQALDLYAQMYGVPFSGTEGQLSAMRERLLLRQTGLLDTNY